MGLADCAHAVVEDPKAPKATAKIKPAKIKPAKNRPVKIDDALIVPS
jgi:hypothetical protein